MKKTFQLEDLDCASCAAKLEHAVAKLDGVESVRVNFMRQSIVLEAEDGRFDDVVKRMKKAIKKTDPDVSLIL